MPTEINGYSPSEETALSSLVINEVDSNETFKKMKEKGLLQDNQLYLVTDENPAAGGTEIFVGPEAPTDDSNVWIDTDAELSGGGVDIPASDTEPAIGNYWLDTSAEGGTYYTAGEVDGLLVNKAEKTQLCNPNLLDNWYFGNAVNQRGATGSITINRYFIDRWLYANGDSESSLTFNNGVVTLNGNNVYCALRQIFETPKSVFIGRRMTISALTTELGLISHTFTCLDGVENYKNFSDTGSFFKLDTREDNVFFDFVSKKETISVIACKVEFGDQQTLAHQENSVWVLNEIPDYGEQLARCQRYFQIIPSFGTYGVDNWSSDVEVHYKMPTTMRTKPTAIIPSNLTNALRELGNTSLTPTSIALTGSSYMSTESVLIDVYCSGLTIGKAYSIAIPIQLIADL